MNSDIRINVGFFQHHKTKKLIYKLDHKGVTALLSLWTYAAQNKPKGILSNMDKIDISLASCWDGDANEFVDTLVSIGFLEDKKGVYSIHDWEKNNPYAFHAEERSEHARKAAVARWEDTDSRKGACPEHARSNAPSPTPSPVPDPSPEPKPKKRKSAEAALAFERFWEQVPNKIARGKAEIAFFNALKKPGVTAEIIIAGIPKYVYYENRRMKQDDYKPLHPSTWLNQKRWTDEFKGMK